MEMLMVVCFGLSWPLNIAKAWKARSTKGMSLPFYLLIWTGYLFAITGKCITIYDALYVSQTAVSWTDAVKWYVMFFYVLNGIMLTVGILVYFRNRKLETKKEMEE